MLEFEIVHLKDDPTHLGGSQQKKWDFVIKRAPANAEALNLQRKSGSEKAFSDTIETIWTIVTAVLGLQT